MRREDAIFLLAGLGAGVLAVLAGRLVPWFLTVGVGVLLFGAVICSVGMSGKWHCLRPEVWRYPVAGVVSIAAYLVGLVAFSVIMGLSQQWLGVRQSADIIEFRADVCLGLAAGAIVASAGIALLKPVLTGVWDSRFLLQLIVAGAATIVVTFVVNLPFQNYWSSLGVLLPLGSALYCWLVGIHLCKVAVRP